MKYRVVYSVADTYETYVEIDDDSSDPRADIEDYLNDNALEEVFDRPWTGRNINGLGTINWWVGGGLIVERYYPMENVNA